MRRTLAQPFSVVYSRCEANERHPARCGARESGETMPFVNIRLVEGRSQDQKNEISTRIVDAISDVLQLPKDDIWVVFEDVSAGDWYVGSTTVAALREKAQK
jgi:4-oxalocrotonate tautomerase